MKNTNLPLSKMWPVLIFYFFVCIRFYKPKGYREKCQDWKPRQPQNQQQDQEWWATLRQTSLSRRKTTLHYHWFCKNYRRLNSLLLDSLISWVVWMNQKIILTIKFWGARIKQCAKKCMTRWKLDHLLSYCNKWNPISQMSSFLINTIFVCLCCLCYKPLIWLL